MADLASMQFEIVAVEAAPAPSCPRYTARLVDLGPPVYFQGPGFTGTKQRMQGLAVP